MVPVTESPQSEEPVQFPVQLDVDWDALVENAYRLREYADGARMLAVVKANAYGFGRSAIADRLWDLGIRWFGVSKLPEAIALRQNFTEQGIEPEDARILVWLNYPDGDWDQAIAYDLDVSVSNLRQLDQVVRGVRVLREEDPDQVPARIHLKVDVGMGRGGATLEDLAALAEAVRQAIENNEVELVGFWSHLSCADDPEGVGAEITDSQIKVFEKGLEIIEEAGIEPQIRHLAASSGTIWHPNAHFDMVRPGISLYGYTPNVAAASSEELGLTPVGTLRAPIVQVKQVEPGQTVSYGATWTSPDRRWIGLLPLGYADGVPRQISNQVDFLIETEGMYSEDGRVPARLLGRVCMDQMVIDLGAGNEPAARVGDSVILFGDPAKGEPSVDTWAQLAGTINYEIVSRLPKHLFRIYSEAVEE